MGSPENSSRIFVEIFSTRGAVWRFFLSCVVGVTGVERGMMFTRRSVGLMRGPPQIRYGHHKVVWA